MTAELPQMLIGGMLQKSLQIVKNPVSQLPGALVQQEAQLKRLLHTARKTAFGRHHQFKQLLQEGDLVQAYQQAVPLTDYDAMYEKWWRFSLEDEADICWPGVVPYYALSSGTSAASSKYIPVTTDMISDMKRATRRMFMDLGKYKLSARQFSRQMLMVGSCTNPHKEGKHFVGDLSGIIGRNRPLWLEKYYQPGRQITDLPEWQDRIEAIVKQAPKWDIGFAVANPMWLQLIFEQIMERYQLENIHDIWPNLQMLVHGGVLFEPYRHSLERLMRHPLHYVDYYAASEGFIARQAGPDCRDLQLQTDCGIYFEFVPFTEAHFSTEGNLLPGAKATLLRDVTEKEDYALILSTSAGAWRYLLGDTIRFTDVSRLKFRITGRTKQFLSVCGEHLSMDNLNEALRRAELRLGAAVREFAVAAMQEDGRWKHQWWISVENPSVPADALMQAIDVELQQLNDDYATERRYALKMPQAHYVPQQAFYQLLQDRNKFNGQAKIPKILKGEVLEKWYSILERNTLMSADFLNHGAIVQQ